MQALEIFGPAANVTLLERPLRSVTLVAVSVVASLADTQRRREWALLGNLGMHPGMLASIFAASAVGGEALLATVRPAG